MLKARLAAPALKKLFREAYVATHTANCIVRLCHGLREGEREGDDDENNIESGKKVGVFIKEKLCEM